MTTHRLQHLEQRLAESERRLIECRRASGLQALAVGRAVQRRLDMGRALRRSAPLVLGAALALAWLRHSRRAREAAGEPAPAGATAAAGPSQRTRRARRRHPLWTWLTEPLQQELQQAWRQQAQALLSAAASMLLAWVLRSRTTGDGTEPPRDPPA